MLVTKYIEIDMGHRVPNHKSKCRNIHGHRYKIEVGVDDKVITKKEDSSEGMVIDFGDIKQVMIDKIDTVYDHGYVISYEDIMVEHFKYFFEEFGTKIIFVPFVPTAENLAKHWFKILDEVFVLKKINLQHVRVWETPTSTATYTREDEYNEIQL